MSAADVGTHSSTVKLGKQDSSDTPRTLCSADGPLTSNIFTGSDFGVPHTSVGVGVGDGARCFIEVSSGQPSFSVLPPLDSGAYYWRIMKA